MPKKLKVSPSQIDTYIRCPRAWWLRSIKKLYGPRKAVTILGDIGHKCIERFHEGVDLYPAGWEFETSRWTGKRTGEKLNLADQSLVKALISHGIKHGTLVKEPDGQVEKEFKLFFDAALMGGVDVEISMFLDLLTGESVDDNKFVSSTRYHSAEKLRGALAMNLYGIAGYVCGHFSEEQASIWLRYLLFVKKGNITTKRIEVEVTKEDLEAQYENIVVPNCQKMAQLSLREVKEEDWCKVGCAEDKRMACSAFGGCDYLDICSGKITVAEFRARQNAKPVDNAKKQDDAMKRLKAGNVKTKKKESGGKKMAPKKNFLAGLKQKQSGEKTTPAAAKPPKETPVEKPAAKTTAPAAAGTTAPWYFEGCKCKDHPVPGFNKTVDKPCMPCRVKAKMHNDKSPDNVLPLATDFEISTSDNGAIVVSLDGDEIMRTGGVEVAQTKDVVEPTPEESVVEEPVVEEPTPEEPVVEEPVVKEEPPKAEAPKTEPVTMPADNAEMSREGFEPERTGMVLSYAAVRSRKRSSKKLGESNCVVQIGELMALVAAGILEVINADGGGCEHYYQIPHGQRIDLIRMNGEAIAKMVGKSIVDASSALRGSDELYVCAAIERYADLVHGVAQ